MIGRKPLMLCELEYFPSPHLMQLYTGFFELHKRGIINLKIRPKTIKNGPPIISALINNQAKIIYDAIDGLSWIAGDRSENLAYFKNSFQCDFYFKRSYHQLLQQFKPDGCSVLPLGLNYNVQPAVNLLHLTPSVKEKLKYVLKTNKLLRPFSKKRFYYAKDFEGKPTASSINKILFITRLWDPKEAKSEFSKIHREQINEKRIDCIDACRKAFGKLFTGGISMDSFSASKYKAYALPNELTNKGSYLTSVKAHSICIATTGLHDSIGWKLAEYVSASKAIVSEPLHYELPGDFKKEQNYLEFHTAQELVKQIERLLNNNELLMQMMEANYRYYNSYVKPEKLILNTLLKVVDTSKLFEIEVIENDLQNLP